MIPEVDDERARSLAAEIVRDLAGGPPVRTATSAWRPGDDGDSVIVRAKAGLV